MVQSGIALPATQKDLSIPITPWLPMKWPFGFSSCLVPQSSWECLWAILQRLRILPPWNTGGLVTGSVGPSEGGEEGAEGWESGASFLSGKGIH